VNLIRFTPIAFESLGVRSMCTFVETPDVKILIDPGVALGPRFRLLPHPREYQALRDSREKIRKYSRISDIITISHYHHDHFTPNFTDTTWLASSPREAETIYRGKTVMVKDARSSTNVSQRRRGWIFQTFCRKIADNTVIADGRGFDYGDTKVRFSAPLPHGDESTELGSVLALVIESSTEKFIHASDIQGPMSDSALQFVLNEEPSAVMIGGPPTYLSGVKVPKDSIARGMQNLEAIARRVPLVIVDHHLLRDEDSIEELSRISVAIRPLGRSIMTAAEYINKRPRLLEANRATIYHQHPPSRQFIKWTKLGKEKQRLVKPPLEGKREKRGRNSEAH